MKKIMTLAAMFAAVAVSFSACTKDNADDKPNTGNEGNETPDYVAPITVDGDFADWQTLGDKAEIAVCPEDALKLGLKEFRAYADEIMLYVYVKFDLDVVTDRDAPVKEDGVTESGNPLALFFSTSTENGGYANTWSDACVEYHCASSIFNGTEQYDSWDDALYMWTGELHGAGWSWDSALESLAATGAGTGDQYEIAIMMDVLTSVMELDGQILLGAMIQQGWNNAGALPCASPDPDNNPNGMAPMMVVPIN